ncbi:LysR family transcriptional regulator [Enterobacter sp. Bisph1]|uniref:helix-turn-helix domain-containing protein n=1 Tax=Enterobacter sp. Bisph1 TaxID=1274399 RepID=UPI000A7270DE|nr:LysR family transcriptional regulator [Enterobacter sp. Bisph1]
MILSKRIVYFLTLVESECYVVASDKLCITVSALRHSMSELEKLVDEKLLKKNCGGIKLTEAGFAFYTKLLPVYELAYNTFETYKQKDIASESIRIFISGFYYPDIFFKARSIMKKSLFNLYISQGQADTHKNCTGSQFDLYIYSSVSPYADFQRNMYQIFLSQEKLGILVTKKMKHKYADISELIRSEKIILRNSLREHPFIDMLKKNISELTIAWDFLWLPDFTDVLNAIQDNMGFTFFPASMITYLPIKMEEYEFILQPFKKDMIIDRYICFDKKNFEQLIKIATSLKSESEIVERETCM